MMSRTTTAWAPPSWSRLIASAAIFFTLFFFDAIATSVLIGRGAEEAMPLPDTMLNQGYLIFVGWKAWIALFGGMMFLFSSRLYRWCWWATHALILGLAFLAAWHVYFLWFFNPQ